MNLTGMNSDEINELKPVLLDAVPKDGTNVGNKALRDGLGWNSDTYLDVRRSLIDDGELVLGRGRGGSVRRLFTEPADATPDASDEESGPFPNEESLYDPMLEAIRGGWINDQSFDDVIVEDTSRGGARPDGIWSRPDITVLANTKYTYVPNTHFDVITFEVKHYKRLDVTAVYEALAHRRSATRAYVLVYVPDQALPQLESPTLADIADEAIKHGVGFIIAADPKDYDTWDVREVASNVTPDPARLDKFIRNQLSGDTREQIVRWFRA